MTDPTDSTEDTKAGPGLGTLPPPPAGHVPTASEKARAGAPVAELSDVDDDETDAAVAELLEAGGEKEAPADPLAGLRRATGGTVTDRARRSGSAELEEGDVDDELVEDEAPVE